jgi:hypothetical protein
MNGRHAKRYWWESPRISRPWMADLMAKRKNPPRSHWANVEESGQESHARRRQEAHVRPVQASAAKRWGKDLMRFA